MKNESKNIAAKKQDGWLLEEKYKKMVAVLAAHHVALWEYDIATGTCDFSDDYFRVLGLEGAGVSYTDMDGFYDTLHPDDVAAYRKSFEHMLESGTENTSIRGRCIGKYGQVVWLEDNYFFYERDEDGLSKKLVAYTANVTEECEKERHIEQLQERNRKIVGALPEFIFIFDDNFILMDVLMSENTVLLHTMDELIGADARAFYSPEVSDLFIRNIRECLRDGKLKEIQYPLDKDGVRYYFQARIAPFEGNKALALIHDVGEHVRRSEELIEAKRKAEEADRMKSVFLATMSHEIRTPLNAIVGFSELIASGEAEGCENEYIEIIRRNSNLLLQLIDDVLDLSRIESGKSEMHFQQVEIAGLLEEVGKVHQPKMPQGVALDVVSPQQGLSVLTDRNRMTQVLFNFLSNAIKNTQQGSVTLGAEAADGWLELYVADTGCGIAEEKLPAIFERFEKLNDFVQGTGLGLSICQSIAERLGGHIDVRSKEGEGSRFSLHLPFSEQEAKVQSVSEVAPKREKRASGRRKEILVAEDVEANFKLLEALLKKEYTLRWVSDGQEAVRSFVRERPDLVLMDIKMPVMNGIEATERIRAISPDVPIIAVTAHAFYTEKQQALEAGCNDIISKPYSLADLKARIEAWI